MEPKSRKAQLLRTLKEYPWVAVQFLDTDTGDILYGDVVGNAVGSVDVACRYDDDLCLRTVPNQSINKWWGCKTYEDVSRCIKEWRKEEPSA